MNPWDRWGRYPSSAKRPPPEHGIKLKKTGTTWWGRRWIEALERMSLGYSNRLARGRSYARAGRTHDLVVKAGHVTARVTGSRPTPYRVTMELAKLPDVTWKKAIATMAAKAQFAAELLAGQMPKEIDEAFRAGGGSLFPAKEADLVTDCSCPDWANPCKHVAATHYVVGEALDRDPFLLFELRGRTKQQVLEALRAARTEQLAPTRGRDGHAREAPRPAEVEVPKISLGKLKPEDYDRLREKLPSLHLSFDAPRTHGAVLRQLGTPPGWNGEGSPADLFGPWMRAAAEQARRLALAEPEPEPETSRGVDRAPSSAPREQRPAPRRRSVPR